MPLNPCGDPDCSICHSQGTRPLVAERVFDDSDPFEYAYAYPRRGAGMVFAGGAYNSPSPVITATLPEPEAGDDSEVFRCIGTDYRSRDRSQFTEHEGQLYENSCFERNFKKCLVSGEYYRTSDMYIVHSARNCFAGHVCSVVLSRNYFYCQWFNNYMPIAERREVDGIALSAHSLTQGALIRCRCCDEEHAFCYLERSLVDRDLYCPRHCPQPVIRSWDSKPSFTPIGQGPLYYGVELEFEVETGEEFDQDDNRGRDTPECQAAATVCLEKLNKTVGDFAIAKHDGSITHGFELVTRPASRYTQRRNWKRLYKDIPTVLGSKDCDGKQTCGMHVHVSRKPLKTLQVAMMMLFVNHPKNKKFIAKIAGRSPSRYCQIKDKKAKHSKSYARFNNRRGQSDEIEVNQDRYEALNLANTDTVEFRIFKVPLTFDGFLKNLEFCAALVDMCHRRHAIPLSQCVKHETFIKFVDERKDKYPALWQFLEGEGLLKVPVTAENPHPEQVIDAIAPEVELQDTIITTTEILARAAIQSEATGLPFSSAVAAMMARNERLRDAQLLDSLAPDPPEEPTGFDVMGMASREEAVDFIVGRIEAHNARIQNEEPSTCV